MEMGPITSTHILHQDANSLLLNPLHRHIPLLESIPEASPRPSSDTRRSLEKKPAPHPLRKYAAQNAIPCNGSGLQTVVANRDSTPVGGGESLGEGDV